MRRTLIGLGVGAALFVVLNYTSVMFHLLHPDETIALLICVILGLVVAK